MPRPRKQKIVHASPIPQKRAVFKPAGIPMTELEVNGLSFVEFEAIRLIDGDQLSQNSAAEMMGISQPTISRLLNAGRQKIADALVNGKALRIEGGEFKFTTTGFCCQKCDTEWNMDGSYAPEKCPKCDSDEITAIPNESQEH